MWNITNIFIIGYRLILKNTEAAQTVKVQNIPIHFSNLPRLLQEMLLWVILIFVQGGSFYFLCHHSVFAQTQR